MGQPNKTKNSFSKIHSCFIEILNASLIMKTDTHFTVPLTGTV